LILLFPSKINAAWNFKCKRVWENLLSIGAGDNLTTNSLLRHINALRCLRVLRRGIPLSRADIGRELGITRATVGNSINPLLSEGLVIESQDQGEGGRAGRPGVLVALNPSGAYFIGLDISTTAINAVLIDFAMRTVAKRTLSISEHYRDAPHVINLLAELPRQLIETARLRNKQIRGLCVSIPGIVKGGCIVSAPWLGWQDVDLRTLLSKQIKARWPIEVCNDAVALASAVRAEAGENEMQDVLLILLAQGIGSAHIRQGRIVEGAHGFAGEIGHMVMGDRARLAASHTFEIMAGYERFLPFIPGGQSISEGLVTLSLVDKPHQELANQLEEWGAVLAAGLLNLIHILDPQNIVLGGPLAVLYPRVAEHVRHELASYLVHGFKVPPISVTRCGADGAAIGAAALVRDALFALPELAPS
jgi:predicted NBD/HSP70 family sugar kinase